MPHTAPTAATQLPKYIVLLGTGLGCCDHCLQKLMSHMSPKCQQQALPWPSTICAHLQRSTACFWDESEVWMSFCPDRARSQRRIFTITFSPSVPWGQKRKGEKSTVRSHPKADKRYPKADISLSVPSCLLPLWGKYYPGGRANFTNKCRNKKIGDFFP